MSSHTVTVGGRRLAVHDHGAPDGPVILQHHGTPSMGRPFAAWVEDVERRGARLLSYDRPGYGGSDPAPERSVADAARDSAAILDALGVERCVTWGISGGGPHALACAALLGDRIAAAASLGGVAPFEARGLNWFRGMGADNLLEFGLVMAGREFVEPHCTRAAEGLRAATADAMLAEMDTLLPEVDLAVLDGELGAYLAEETAAALAQGVDGWVDDDLAFVSPYGFAVSDIAVPTLVVHGHHDLFVPLDHGRWLADSIHGAEAWLSEDDGHLTLGARRVPEVHEWLLDHLG
jgi:pimeloyl-ACP methyl ester carboxylesterase